MVARGRLAVGEGAPTGGNAHGAKLAAYPEQRRRAGKIAGAGVLVYQLLFFAFGYYVAWQSPAVRTFYGGTDPGSFVLQMRTIIAGDPFLLLFEGLRGLLWTTMAALLLWALKARAGFAVLLLALVLALVENDTHLIPNPLMPTIVRQVHFVETASSNFLFGLIAGVILLWLPVSAQAPVDLG